MPTLNNLESSPGFATLSYEEQIKTRAAFANRYITPSFEFKQLQVQEKDAVFKSVLFRPPVLKDKVLESQVKDLWGKAQKGDQEALKKMQAAVVWGRFKDQSLIVNSFDKFLVAPLIESTQGRSELTPEVEQRQITLSDEGTKVLNSFDTILSQDIQRAKSLGIYKTLASIGGALTDFAIMYGTLAGTSVSGARGVGKFAQVARNMVDAGSKSVGRSFLGAIVGEATHAGITSIMGVAREWGREAIEDGLMENHSFQEAAIKSAKWFGQYYVGDLAVNWMAGVLWPMTKIGFKGGLKGYGDVKLMWENLDPVGFKKLTQAVFSGETLNNKMLLSLPKQVQLEAFTTNAAFRVGKRVDRLTEIDAARAVTKLNGFNMIDNPKGGWDINPIGGDIKPTTVNNIKEINDYMMTAMAKEQMNPLFVLQDVKEFSKRAAGSLNTKVIATISGKLPPSASKNIDILSRLAAPVGGKFQRGKLEAFVKTFVKGNGGGDDVIKGLKVIDKDNVLQIFSKEGKLLDIPKGKLSPTDEVIHIKNLTTRLAELTPEGKGIPVGEGFIRKYSESLVKQNLFTAEWMSHVVDMSNGNLVKKGAKWLIQSKVDPQAIQPFDSLEQVGEYLIRKNINIDMLKQSADMHGYRFVGNIKSEVFKLKKGNMVVASGKTLNELVDKVPKILPKIDSVMGPQLTIVKDTGILGVRFTKDSIAVSNQQTLMKFLDKFRKKSFGGSTFSLTGGSKGRIEFYRKSKQFEVVVGDIGERRVFNKVGEARKYLEEGWKEMNELTFSALKKGYRLDYKVGKWFLYTDDGQKHIFNTFEEMTVGLKKVPVPEWAPELTGLPEEMMDSYVKPTQAFFRVKEPDFGDGPLSYSILAKAGVMWAPPKSTLERMVKEGGNPAGLKIFNDIEAARTFVIGREGEFRKMILTIFDDGRGKTIKKKVRKWIGQYVEAPDDVARGKVIEDALKTDKVKFGRRELEAAEKLRTFYGTTPDEGAFAYFGVPREKFIENYLPHIKAFYFENPKLAFTDGKIHEYLAQVFNNKVPRELDAFFKHSRTSDLLDVALEKDPMEQLFRYTNIGLKEKYLGKLIEEAKTLKLDTVMRKRLNNYLAQIGGLPQGNAQEIIRSITPQILMRFGINPKLTNDITSWLMSLGYSASMGFRPWLPIRNMNQIWTTLAMRMQGNHWVKQALADVSGPKGEEIFNYLRKRGDIMSSLPLFGSEVLDQADFLKNITYKSLLLYKNSDHFTRAIAFQAATLKFDDAFKRIKSIDLKPDEFAHMSGISQMDPVGRRQVMSMMNEGNMRGARDIYASSIVTETMFPYRSGMAPLAFSGTLGKMFGMMGHYSAYYVDNIRRSIKYMTPGEKLLAGSIMVGNSTALYGAFRAIGVKADNFKPWEPALFSGGPSWEIMQDLLDATGGGPEGKQSRAAFLGLSSKNGKVSFNPMDSTFFKWTVPGAFEWRNIQDAVELTNAGDSWGAFLTSMGAPYSDDWNVFQ
jgi:hypothetical protein